MWKSRRKYGVNVNCLKACSLNAAPPTGEDARLTAYRLKYSTGFILTLSQQQHHPYGKTCVCVCVLLLRTSRESQWLTAANTSMWAILKHLERQRRPSAPLGVHGRAAHLPMLSAAFIPSHRSIKSIHFLQYDRCVLRYAEITGWG